jgi:hypothetical protein
MFDTPAATARKLLILLPLLAVCACWQPHGGKLLRRVVFNIESSLNRDLELMDEGEATPAELSRPERESRPLDGRRG